MYLLSSRWDERTFPLSIDRTCYWLGETGRLYLFFSLDKPFAKKRSVPDKGLFPLRVSYCFFGRDSFLFTVFSSPSLALIYPHSYSWVTLPTSVVRVATLRGRFLGRRRRPSKLPRPVSYAGRGRATGIHLPRGERLWLLSGRRGLSLCTRCSWKKLTKGEAVSGRRSNVWLVGWDGTFTLPLLKKRIRADGSTSPFPNLFTPLRADNKTPSTPLLPLDTSSLIGRGEVSPRLGWSGGMALTSSWGRAPPPRLEGWSSFLKIPNFVGSSPSLFPV